MADELTRKVKLYLSRAKNRADSWVKYYPPEKVGYWMIMGGSGDDGRCYLNKILHGKFIDAVTFAVQQEDFYGGLMTYCDPGNCNNGYVEKIEVTELEDSGLAKLLKSKK